MSPAGRPRTRAHGGVSFPRQRRGLQLAALLAGTLAVLLAGCTLPWVPKPDQILTIGTVLPETGPDAAIGLAMEHAVDLAVTQHAKIAKGYRLTATHADEEAAGLSATVRSLTANQQVLGIVGPFDGQDVAAMTAALAAQHLVAISASETLAGSAQAAPAPPKGSTTSAPSVSMLSLLPRGPAAGQAAADLAVATQSAHGFAASAVFVVDDGSAFGKATSAAFAQELKAKHGSVAGQQSIAAADPLSVQKIVSAIVAAQPDLVFFAGGTEAGAALRGTITLTGVPQIPMLAVGPMADNPGWAAAVGDARATGNVASLLPAPDLSALPAANAAKANAFVAAYQKAYPGDQVLPQSALAYDAAMAEITAIQSRLQPDMAPTRAAVLAAVASAHYTGVTGTLTFDQTGALAAPSSFSLYTFGSKGAWQFVSAVGA
jgi:ABC-type branched-subunit amino acid transport system substrate-binding protein